MKARTLIITVGATIALVGGTVQPAGAKVASACSVSAKKVLVVGNGTKTPYYSLGNGQKASYHGLGLGTKAPSGTACRKTAKPATRAHRPAIRNVVAAPRPAAAPVPSGPVTSGGCEFAVEAVDEGYSYIAIPVVTCPDQTQVASVESPAATDPAPGAGTAAAAATAATMVAAPEGDYPYYTSGR
jgi:hypothetical protein